jgi:hypothetical protein
MRSPASPPPLSQRWSAARKAWRTFKAAASTLVSQDNALRLARAQHRYGYDTGTGYAACDVALIARMASSRRSGADRG